MRAWRVASFFLLALALSFQGFASAAMRTSGALRAHRPAASASQREVASFVAGSASDHSKADRAAPAERPMPCCQPAVVPTHAWTLTVTERPRLPQARAIPSSTWTERVPRKPPRA
jgi:hypothetical protein